MSRSIATVLLAVLLTGCGGAAAPTPVPTIAPAAPSTPSPSPSVPPSSAPTFSGASGSSVFVDAGLSASLDVNGDFPSSSTFGKTFPSNSQALYVAFRLVPGLAGTVTSTWKSADGGSLVKTFHYPASAPWAYFKVTFQKGFALGDGQEVLNFGPAGESITLPFTITGATGASPAPSGSSTFTLLQMATAADRSKAAPDPATFTDTFPTTAKAIFVVFALGPGLTGTVTMTLTRGGSSVIKPISLNITVADGWSDFKVTSTSGFPAGTYEATVTYAPTGEAQTVTFSVK